MKRGGYTLVEILVYAGLMVLIIVLLANTITSLAQLFSEAKEERTLRTVAETTLERIAREIRFAETIDTGASTLDAHPGVLALTTIDPFTETAQTITFFIDSGRVVIQKDAGPLDYITPNSTTATNLVFRHILNSTNSETIRTELTLDEKNFYTTTVLRRSY